MRTARTASGRSSSPAGARYLPLILALALSAIVYARVSSETTGVFDISADNSNINAANHITINTGTLWPDDTVARPTWRDFFAAYELEDNLLQRSLREYTGQSVSECDVMPARREIKIYLRADIASENAAPSPPCEPK